MLLVYKLSVKLYMCSMEDPPFSNLVGPVSNTITIPFFASATVTTTLTENLGDSLNDYNT